eukprot:5714649-Pyramimonas_sp.AAC.1
MEEAEGDITHRREYSSGNMFKRGGRGGRERGGGGGSPERRGQSDCPCSITILRGSPTHPISARCVRSRFFFTPG